jgi:hypothetical protein
MDRFKKLSDRRIREAVVRGDFNEPPWAGEPLKLDEPGPFGAPTLWMAFHILKNNGMAPAGIEERKELAEAAGKARERLRRTGDESHFREEMAAINRKVDRHHLRCPVPSNLRPRFPMDEVLAEPDQD